MKNRDDIDSAIAIRGYITKRDNAHWRCVVPLSHKPDANRDPGRFDLKSAQSVDQQRRWHRISPSPGDPHSIQVLILRSLPLDIRAGVLQDRASFGVAVMDSQAQRRPAVIFFHIDIGARGNQGFGSFGVAVPGSEVQRRPAAFLFHIHIGARGNQGFGNFRVALPGQPSAAASGR